MDLFGSPADDQNGVEDVKQAIIESEELSDDLQLVGEMGEPTIEPIGESAASPSAISIPVEHGYTGGCTTLLFPFPLEEGNFSEILSSFGLDVEELEELQGQEVPLTIERASLAVDWEALSDDGNSTDDGESGEHEQQKAVSESVSLNVQTTEVSSPPSSKQEPDDEQHEPE